jgi:hypothetical protein
MDGVRMRLSWLGLMVLLLGCHTSTPCEDWCEEHFTKDKQCGTSWSGSNDECSDTPSETAGLEAFCDADTSRIANESCDDWNYENDTDVDAGD